MKRRNIQVLCLQETRWKGAKTREIREGVKLSYSGEDTKRNGVAIAMAVSLKASVFAVNGISSRIMAVLPEEVLTPQHTPLLADIVIDLPKKLSTRTERRIRWWNLHQFERGHLKEKVLEAGLPNPNGPIQQAWSNAVKVILRCAKETLGRTRGGFRGDKEAWIWNDEAQRVVKQKRSAYKRWQRTRTPEDLIAYRASKRLAKAAVAEAKNTELDASYEKLDSRE
ncbi:hypothetical protein V3C99_011856 [Haemonchus contortus]|uniref:RNase H domain-containing protein n=1 Tax=Haemonchus contortus TaxID=6289 RepID=A0A7I4Y6E3_HAECO